MLLSKLVSEHAQQSCSETILETTLQKHCIAQTSELLRSTDEPPYYTAYVKCVVDEAGPSVVVPAPPTTAHIAQHHFSRTKTISYFASSCYEDV